MSDKFSSLEDLKAYAATLSIDKPDKIVIAVGAATCGIAAGAKETIDALNSAIRANNLLDVEVVETGCLGCCYAEPLVEVRMPGAAPVRYAGVDPKLAEKIIVQHIIEGAVVANALMAREVPR